MENKGKTWSRGTNSRLPFGVNVNLNLSSGVLIIAQKPQACEVRIDYGNCSPCYRGKSEKLFQSKKYQNLYFGLKIYAAEWS